MLNSILAIDIMIRLSIVLAIGWLALRISAKQNPRWSVLITRCMIIAGLGFPVVYVCLPSTTLAVLPAPSTVISEDAQTTLPSPVKVNHEVQEEPGRQPLAPTTNVISEPVIVETESRLPVPALRESETAVMVPQIEVADLPVVDSDPVSNISEASPDETLVKDTTATVIPQKTPATHSTVSGFQWLGFCWLAGCILLLLKIGFQIRQAKQLLRTSVAASESIQGECEMLARNLSLRSIPRVCVSTAINGPCTAGLLRPSIFLPDSWSESLSDEERRAVLMHELSHIAGQDSLWDLVSRIVAALWWFHPLVWRLTSQHRLACEHMSDARAADSIAGFKAYRQMLAQWTLRRQGAESNSAVLAMADRSFMLRRLKWLEAPRSFETLGRVRRTAFLFIAVLISFSVASIKFIPQAVAQKPEDVEQTQKPEDSKPISTKQEDVKKENTEKIKSGQPGRIIHVKAVDSEGKPLKDAYPLLEQSDLFGREFKRDKDRVGYFTSPMVSRDRRWMRVVDGSGDGPILFSDLIDVTKPEQVTQEGAIVATLRPGIRLEGRLDESVPRPIKNGCVELYINEGETHRIGGWSWQDTAFVQEDGTFVFESLPAGGHVQLFALVDGYQSIRRSEETLAEYLRLQNAGDVSLLEALSKAPNAFRPQLFPLPKRQAKTEIVLPCTRSAALDVTVFYPTGSPIRGADVKFNPSGLFLGGKEFFPTHEVMAKASLVRHPDPTQVQRLHDWANSTFLEAKTDFNGVAQVRNLPTQGRHKFRVWAPGVNMPAYPTIDTPAYPVIDIPFTSRYAEIDLSADTTLQRTITMEKSLPTVFHKVLVVDDQGKPLPEMKVTVSEITFQNAPDNWHVWSKQRFGSVPSGKTDVNGQVSLRLPLRVYNQTVTRMRVILKGDISQDVPIYKHLTVPLDSDKRIYLLIVSKPLFREIQNLHDVEVEVVPYDKFGGNSSQKVMQHFLKSPSLVILNKLLELAKFDAATPLRIRRQMNWQARATRNAAERDALFFSLNHMNWDELNNRKKLGQVSFLPMPRFENQPKTARQTEKEMPSYRLIHTDQGERVVVLCDVRSRHAIRKEKPSDFSAPVAAFIFNVLDGSLIRMLGGKGSSTESENGPILICMGGTDDFFLLTTEKENYGPFDQTLRWYRIGLENEPALTVYNHKHAIGWSGTFSPSSPLAEYGEVDYRLSSALLKGKPFDRTRGGTLPDGTQVPRKMYWDGTRNQFMSPVTQSYDGQPLYQVVPEESAEFKPLDVQSDDLIVAGGRTISRNWHSWDVVIPAGKTAQLRLFSVDETGKESVETELQTQDLSAGVHSLRIRFRYSGQFRFNKQNEQVTEIDMRVDELKPKEVTIPYVQTDSVPSVKNKPVVRTSKTTLDLLHRETVQSKQRLVWRVELKSD
ncbi:Methicillin resistance mecR1 protein [Gimesia alba]|uniref:Methicillin resistance mecR1 protein n=1 Tax=Gimesia alba TaxID=2527973 RepID=A0A517RMG3_9PLAN|nr:M56 family metallopeptidase [Gimesia alba]QDT45071.1 Methicillin resistance mecR1 protein [Gimesia alba]